jgi:hypothetical protein
MIIDIQPPFPDATRTGRAFVPPCGTATIIEFRIGAALWLAQRYVRHGWSPAWPGSIEDITYPGTLLDADGRARQSHPAAAAEHRP